MGSRRVEPVCSTASRIKIRQRPMPRSTDTNPGCGTVMDRSLRDAKLLGNARFHGTTRRSFPTGRGDPVIRKRWKIHIHTERHTGIPPYQAEAA